MFLKKKMGGRGGGRIKAIPGGKGK